MRKPTIPQEGPGDQFQPILSSARAPVNPVLQEKAGDQLRLVLTSLWQFIQSVLRPIRLRATSRRLRVVESLTVGNKQTISLLRVDGQDFLVGITANSVSLLAGMDPQQDQTVDMAEVQRLATTFYSNVQ